MSESGLPSPGFNVAVPPGTHPDASEQGRLITKFIDALWRYRELLYFFAWRDVKVRYRQAVLGLSWAVIQPLATMILFSEVFGRLAHMPSNGIPYPIFSYCALVPWTYFNGVVTLSSTSLISNSSLVTKVYFPRMLLPGGVALAGLLDFGIASVLLIGMLFFYHISPSWLLLLIPLVVLLMVLITTGVGLFTAALTVRYRDMRHLLPFVLQLWMFATPIIYPATMVPPRLRPLLALNPCWGMVDSFRLCLLPKQPIEFKLIGVSILVAITLFAAGLYYFRRVEKGFADII